MSAATEPDEGAAAQATPSTRRLVSAALILFGIVTTSMVSIAVDRHFAASSKGPEHDHEHAEKGHEGHGEGDKGHAGEKEHGDADHPGEGRPGEGHPGEGRDGGGEHKAHVDIAVVKLTDEQIANGHFELDIASGGRVDEILSLPGEIALNADAVAHVSPRAPGAVREVKVSLGDVVKKGEVLALLDSREVAGMQQEALAGQARLELAQANFDRVDALFKDQISSEKEYLASKQALAEARIDKNSAAQKLAAGAGPRSGGSGLALIAPLDGTVIEKHLTIGEVLGAETKAFTIADLSTLWVWTTAHVREAGRVQKGQRAYLRADGFEEVLEGVVDYVDATLDETTRTARLRVTIDHPNASWRPGMFVRTEVVVSQVDAGVVILEEAIQRLGDHEVVFIQEGGQFEARPVELGRPGRDARGRRAREVIAGLPANARYVSKNAFTLKAELGKGSASHEH